MDSLLSKVPGLRLENVVLFQGFSSTGAPLDTLGFVPRLGSDFDYGGSATLSWTHAGPRGAFFTSYTPSHVRRLRFSEWNTTDHVLNLGAHRRLSERWQLDIASFGGVQGLEEFFFKPPVFRPLENPPATFDDLIRAAEAGELSSAEVAAALTGTPVVESQGSDVLDMRRVLSATVGARAVYEKSSRTALHFGVGGAHYQTLFDEGDNRDELRRRFLGRTNSVSATSGVSHHLSPRTTVGAEVNVQRSESDIRDANYMSARASISRRLGRRWTADLRGGVGTIGSINDRAGFSTTDQGGSTWVVGGGLRYNGRAHVVSLAANRDVGDEFGLGARTSYNAGASWTWWRPGSTWGLTADANWYRLSVDGFPLDTERKYGSAGLVRRLSPETFLITEYSYGSFFSPFRGVVSNLSSHRGQISWVWRPSDAPR